MLQVLRKEKRNQRGGSSNGLTFNFGRAAKSYFQQTRAEMQQECCYEIMYHHPKYFRNFSLSCRFFPLHPYFFFFFFFGSGVKCSRWLVLQHSSKQENMQDVGGRGGRNMESALKFQRAWERFGFQDRESSQSVFGKPEICVLCNSSEVGVCG